MRRYWPLHVLGVLSAGVAVACTCSVPAPPDVAGSDSGADGDDGDAPLAEDAPDDSPDVWIDPQSLVTFELERGTECAPWPEVTHPGLGQPLAPPGEPYVVWTWSPVGDPAYLDYGRTDGNRLESLSVGGDGSISAVTPDGTFVTGITHDGETAWVNQVVPRFRDGRIVGPITRTPDGRSYFEVFWSADTPLGFEVVYIDSTGLRDSMRTFRAAGTDPMTATQLRQWMSVGPDGSIYYVTEEDSDLVLIKSCAGGPGYAWRLSARVEGRTQLVAPTNGIAQSDGSMLASLEGGLVRITTEGEVSWLIGPRAVRGGLAMIAGGVYAMATSESDVPSLSLLDDLGFETWHGPPGRINDYRLDPRGRLWTIRDPDGGVVRDRHGEVVWRGNNARFNGERPAWGEDGSVIISGGARTIRRVDGATGEILWEITVGDPGDTAMVRHLDIDGRLYLQVRGSVGDVWGPIERIVAVQTDVRPASDVCLGYYDQHWCNRHENFSMWDYAPR